MLREFFRQMGAGFTFLWCLLAAASLASTGLVVYTLILLISYLRHHM